MNLEPLNYNLEAPKNGILRWSCNDVVMDKVCQRLDGRWLNPSIHVGTVELLFCAPSAALNLRNAVSKPCTVYQAPSNVATWVPCFATISIRFKDEIGKQIGSFDTLNRVQHNSHHKEYRRFCINIGHNCWHSIVLKFQSIAVWIYCTQRSTASSGTLKPQVFSGYFAGSWNCDQHWLNWLCHRRLHGQNQCLYIHTTYFKLTREIHKFTQGNGAINLVAHRYCPAPVCYVALV